MSRRAWGATAAVALIPGLLAGQQLDLGVQGAVGTYRETSSSLRFTGAGFGGIAEFSWKKLGAEVAVTRLSFDPADDGSAVDGFTATQLDARVRYYLANTVSLEVGLLSRQADPEFNAQSLSAIRVGLRSSYPINPSATLVLRAGYLAAAQFSGGGSAGFAMELGLGARALLTSRVQWLADYEFQRFDRKTDPGGSGERSVPIQQWVGRIGVGVILGG